MRYCDCASQQATCSRVAVLNMASALTVNSARNIRHIAETWFSQRKQLVYGVHQLDSEAFNRDAVNRATEATAAGRDSGSLSLVPQQTKCRHVDWYLSNIAASHMFTPSTSNPLHFGILRVSSAFSGSVSVDSFTAS